MESRIVWAAMADEAMGELEADATRLGLLAAVRRVLALLEDDPRQPELRRRRFQIGLWAVMVHSDGLEWVILWEPTEENPDEVVIRYLGAPPGG